MKILANPNSFYRIEYSHRKRKNDATRISISIFILIVTIIFIFSGINKKDSKPTSGTVSSKENTLGEQFQIKPASSLKEAVENALEGTKGTYAVIVKNMKTGETYFSNADRVFQPGSLYKLWVMATVFDKVRSGELKEDQILTQDIAVLNKEFNIDKDQAELTEGTISLSVSAALEQMITISHNYAALLLAKKVKNSQIEDFLKKNSFNNSELGSPPKTTAKDMVLFFEKLYRGKLVSYDYSQKMIDLLKKQRLNEGLPKYLPDTAKVAHKTGDLGWFKHDAGITFTDKGDYIIVILSETESPAGAQERIALTSKSIFMYFTK